MGTLIVVGLVLVGAGLIAAYYLVTKDKNSAQNKYKKLQKERDGKEIKMIRHLKGNANSNISDDIIKNIMNSDNTILEKALEDCSENPELCKKLRR